MIPNIRIVLLRINIKQIGDKYTILPQLAGVVKLVGENGLEGGLLAGFVGGQK